MIQVTPMCDPLTQYKRVTSGVHPGLQLLFRGCGACGGVVG